MANKNLVVIEEEKYISKAEKVTVKIPSRNILSTSDLNSLKGSHASSIESIAQKLRFKYRKKIKMNKANLVEETFIYNKKVLADPKKLRDQIKRAEANESTSETFKYYYFLPSNVDESVRKEIHSLPVTSIRSQVNTQFNIAKRNYKTNGKEFKLQKYIKTFGVQELLKDFKGGHYSVLNAIGRAKKFERDSKLLTEKTISKRNKLSDEKTQSHKNDRIVKEEKAKEPEIPIYVKPEPLVASKSSKKKRNKVSKVKEERKQKKFQNKELRKHYTRRKQYLKSKKEEVSEKKEEKIESKLVSNVPVKEVFSSSSKTKAELRMHNSQMRLRRLKKEATKARVEKISANKARRRKKKTTFTSEAADAYPEELSEDCIASHLAALEDLKKMTNSNNDFKKTLDDFKMFTDKVIDQNDFAVNLLVFIANLLECNNSSQVVTSSWLYMSTLGSSPHIKLAVASAAGTASVLLNSIITWRTQTSYVSESHVSFDGFSPSRILDTVISWGSRFFTSDVYMSIKKFILSLVSMGMFESDVSGGVQKWMGKARRGSILDCAQDLIQSIAQLVRSGEMLVRGYSIEECFFSPDPLKAYITRTDIWIKSLPLVVQGVPPDGKIHIATHVRDGEEILSFLEEAKPKLNAMGDSYNEAMTALIQMRCAVPLLRSQMNSRSRPTPLAIVISGLAGVGKSTIFILIVKIWCVINGIEYDPELVFHKTPSSDYWETYDPTIHRVVHISELGSKTKSVMQNGDLSLSELTSVIDSAPYAVPQAFKGKGKIFCLADLIIIDCNDEDMGIDIIQTNGAAFKRRFLFIRVQPLPQYCKKDSYMLDPNIESPNSFFDKYSYQVVKKIPQKGNKVRDDEIFATNCFDNFTILLAKYMEEYYKQELTVQEKIKAALPEVDKILSERKLKEETISGVKFDPADFSRTSADKPDQGGRRIPRKKKSNFKEKVLEFKSESENLPNPYDDTPENEDYENVELKSESDNLFPEIFSESLSDYATKKVKEEKFYFKEWGMRLGSTALNATGSTYSLIQSGIDTVLVGSTLWRMRKNIDLLRDPFMWAYILLLLILTPYISWYYVLLAILYFFTMKAPQGLYQLRHKNIEYREKVKQTKVVFESFKKKFTDDTTDLMTLPCHTQILGALAIGLSTIAVFKILVRLSKSHDQFDSETSNVLKEKNGKIDAILNCEPAKIRIRHRPDAWNVISGDVPVHTSSPEDLHKKVSRNVKSVVVKIGNLEQRTHILGLKGNVCLINTHALCGKKNLMIHVKMNNVPNCIPSVVSLDETFMYDIGNDCTLIILTGMRFANITPHIADLKQISRASGFYNGGSISKITHESQKLMVKNRIKNFWTSDYWLFKHAHASGDCGKPVIVTTQGGSAVVGIHAAGGDHNDNVVAVNIPSKKLLESIDILISNSGMMAITSEARTNLSFKPDINRKSAINYEDLSSMKIYGSLDMPVMVNMKSKLEKTIFHRETDEMIWDEYGYVATEKFGAPHLQPFHDKKGDWVSPYNLALRKMNKPRGTIKRKVLRKAIAKVTKHIISAMKKKKVRISPLPIQEAINGSLQDYYTRKIDMSKGSGFGRQGKKGQHFDLEVEGKMPKDELMEKIIKRKEGYLRGESFPIIFEATPKDEPRATHKIADGKTRIFYAGYLESLVLARQLLGPVFSLMSEHNLDFCCALGTDPHRDGKKLTDYLRSLSPGSLFGMEKLLEGDYSGYDVSMNTDITWAAFTVIKIIATALGYNADALKILEGLLNDLMHPLIEILGDLIMAIITPSGMLGTAEINTLKGLLIIVYLFLCDPRSEGIDPFDVLRPLIYGDDLLCAISDIIEWFNCKYFAISCKENLGMDFTSAAKGEHESDFVDLRTATFLRRSFLPEGDYVRMPLTLDSVEKTIGWMIPSRFASKQDQLAGALNSFIREIFQRSKRDQYNRIKNWATKIYENEYGHRLFLPTYDEVEESLVPREFISESMIVTDEKQSSLSDLYSSTYLDRDAIIEIRAKYPVAFRAVGTIMFQKMMGIDEGRLPHILNWPAEYRTYLNEKIFQMEEERKELLQESPAGSKTLEGFSRSDIVSLRRYGTDRRFRIMCDEYMKYKARINALELSSMTLRRALKLTGEYHSESAEGIMQEDSVEEIKTENLSDMAGAAITYSIPHPTNNVNVGANSNMDIANYLSRPIRIASYTNVPGATFSQAINPWQAYLSQPSVRAKLRNTAYLTADMHVRIAVSGMPFHYGRYIYSYIPFDSLNEPWKYLNGLAITGSSYAQLMYLSQSPYARTYDVTTNSPTEMVFPYISPLPAMRIYNDSSLVLAAVDAIDDAEDLGTLYLRSLNTLEATSSTPSTVSISVYAWMENVEFGYPTATHLEVTTESDERISGPISSATKSMSEAADTLSGVPIIGSYAKASAQVLNVASNISSALGWSYPTLIDDPMRMKNEPFQNAATTIGMDTGKRIVLDPKQEISVDPSSSGGKEDELVIQTICMREGLMSTFVWEPSATSLSGPLAVIPVTPMLANSMANGVTSGSKEWMVNTPLSMCAIPFHFWRGDIILRFEFVCNMYHRGKVLIGYEPNIRQQTLIDTVLDTNKNFITTVDLQETRCIEVKVKWANALPWLETGELVDHAVANATITANYFRNANGYVYVTPLTTLQSPDDSSIEVNIYVRSDNMHFNCIDSNRFPSEYTAESHLSDCDGLMVELNPSDATEDRISEEYFGEEPLSFRSLLKRFETTYSRGGAPSAGRSSTVLVPTTIPYPIPNFGELPSEVGTSKTLLTFLRYCFLAIRGGFRKRIVVHDMYPASNGSVYVSLSYNDGYAAPSVSGATGGGTTSVTGTVQFLPSTNNGVEFEIPWYTCSTWGFAQTGDYLPNKSYVSQKTTSTYRVVYSTGGPTARPVDILESSATAEDFNLSNFISAYPVIVYTVP